MILPFDENFCNLNSATGCSVMKWCGVSREKHLIDILAQIEPEQDFLQISGHRGLIEIF